MGLFDFFSSGPRPVPTHVPAPGGDHSLVLYQYDSCPFCIRVRRAMSRLGLDIEIRNTQRDPGARTELVGLTGRTQVPCLVIDGEPLLESADIVAWLEAHAAA